MLSDEPRSGDIWRHANGIEYLVVGYTNARGHGQDLGSSHPVTVLYCGPGQRLWTRPMSDWARSFTYVGRASLWRRIQALAAFRTLL